MSKALVANTALVGGLTRVHLLMHGQVGQVLEELVAEATLVGPLLAVHTVVLEEQGGPGKGLPAHLALVRTFPCVCPLVDHQV